MFVIILTYFSLHLPVGNIQNNCDSYHHHKLPHIQLLHVFFSINLILFYTLLSFYHNTLQLDIFQQQYHGGYKQGTHIIKKEKRERKKSSEKGKSYNYIAFTPLQTLNGLLLFCSKTFFFFLLKHARCTSCVCFQ